MSPQHQQLAAPPEVVDDDPPVTSVMTPRIVATTPDCPLHTGLNLMVSRNVRHLPVVEGSRCLGVVLETDIVRAVAIGGPPLLGPLARPMPTVPAGGRRSLAARALLDGDVESVLVTDGDRLVGIVTTTDLVRSLASAPADDDGERSRPGDHGDAGDRGGRTGTHRDRPAR
jgi:CBS domain-containing protein